ncbi:YlmC/YmxH family sporulation protein [Oceanobacillus neutriphilus]|uniref:PRC-barrel domain-containing protein n=1 Tax=Oceanobacillus neutriphilus TaxID=531815 RepID=A0ABQ2NX24_9BACI|nr:YlmC/YmxH family sporulation protein [Oceanobacillus neutriphilus]GGP12462.1 hypothetical protein GCM10011346_28520 [Oceanobacillus neutriphilus]
MVRFRDMGDKEIINVNEGKRLGMLGQTDLEINPKTGQIESFIIPSYKWFGLVKEGEETKIHWQSIKKIGEDMIMIDTKLPDENR